MAFPNRTRNLNTPTRLGLLALVLASFWRWATVNLPGGFIDGAAGLLYGVAIGCLLLGLKRSGCRGSKTDSGPMV